MIALQGRISLKAYRIGADLGEEEGAWERADGVSNGGAVLVRPDGFVDWRSTGASTIALAELTAALATINMV